MEELVGQQHDGPPAALNDFIFEVDDNDQTARVNVSGLTTMNDPEDGMSQQQQQQQQGEANAELLSIQSFFPDLLGGQSGMPQDENNTLDEPLIRSTRRNNRNT